MTWQIHFDQIVSHGRQWKLVKTDRRSDNGNPYQVFFAEYKGWKHAAILGPFCWSGPADPSRLHISELLRGFRREILTKLKA